MLSQLPRYRVDTPVPKLQRVITPTYLLLSSRVLLFLSLTSNSPALKMTRFGFLSLALLSLQAFVGTGFAAVSLIWCARETRVSIARVRMVETSNGH